ncbi:tRNA-guanine transglycosylase [Dentipellis sp. KUC8613]|nr:tRNA-guanine transglycosylase [Dentipellis sp. KUC8613]
MSQRRHQTSFRFELLQADHDERNFGPRLGRATVQRAESDEPITLDVLTPGLIASTSRGLVPHMSRDSVDQTAAIRWVHVPFESFLERLPPPPTLQPGDHPLHTYLGFRLQKHIVTMTLRDPFDGREIPPNGKDFASAYCMRGVRKVKPEDWRNYVLQCNPDVVVATTDIPFTPGNHSQKRTTKSIERSAAWLATLLQPISASVPYEDPSDSSAKDAPHLNVLVHMVGGANSAARRAFSDTLLEPLYAKEADAVKPFKTLDEGVAGYTFDLIPLHNALHALKSEPTDPALPRALKTTITQLDPVPNIPSAEAIKQLPPLLQASLAPLPRTKPRFVHSAGSPHEILALIRDVGVDLFDAHWAQRAADVGIALDFTFPAPEITTSGDPAAAGGKSLGHNLYDTRYTHDFSPFADAFHPDGEATDPRPVCPCMACSPVQPTTYIKHCTLDEPYPVRRSLPYTRAYLHHLLHTHEMSAHTLLAAHNLAVLDAFLAGVRAVIRRGAAEFAREVERFEAAYEAEMRVFGEAKRCWAEVEMARGKGRLTREKEKQEEDTLGTAVEL